MEKKGSEKQFIFYWYKEFGWKNDPFQKIILEPIENYIAGYQDERRKLNYFIIEKLPLCIIRGEKGSGKTTLLTWLKWELKKYKDKVLVDVVDKNIGKTEFVKMLVSPLLSLKEKGLVKLGYKLGIAKNLKKNEFTKIYEGIFSKQPLDIADLKEFFSVRLDEKNIVLILDDVETYSEQTIALIKDVIKLDVGLQAVVAGGDLDKIISGLKQKNTMNIELMGIGYGDAKEMIIKRIRGYGGKEEPFSENVFKKLYERANKTPAKLLDLCRDKAINIALQKIEFEKSEKQEEKEDKEKAEGAGEKEIKKDEKKAVKIEKVKTDINLEKEGVKIREELEKEDAYEKKDEDEEGYKIKVVKKKSSQPYEIEVVEPEEDYFIGPKEGGRKKEKKRKG